jgi:hypothetical protein
MGGWLGPIAQVAGAAGVGLARGKFKRQELDREEMLQALAQEALKRKEARETRGLDLDQQRLTMQDRERTDVLNFRKEDAKTRADDRDADRAARAEASRQSSADRAESRAARTELRPDQREQAAEEFAYRMVASANGDLDQAFALGRNAQKEASRLGVRRDHYGAAARRFKERLTSKTKAAGPGDPELDGTAASAVKEAPSKPAGKSYSSDPMIRSAQEMWDRSPTIQAKRPRPQ